MSSSIRIRSFKPLTFSKKIDSSEYELMTPYFAKLINTPRTCQNAILEAKIDKYLEQLGVRLVTKETFHYEIGERRGSLTASQYDTGVSDSDGISSPSRGDDMFSLQENDLFNRRALSNRKSTDI